MTEQHERRQDYPELLFILDSLRNTTTVLNTRIEKLEAKAARTEALELKIDALTAEVELHKKVASEFTNVQRDIRWVTWISRIIGAGALFLFGDSIKKTLGL